MKDLLAYLSGLTVSQGRLAGQPFKVLPWQRRFVTGAFTPGTQSAALSVARGNGKTAFVAGIHTERLSRKVAKKSIRKLITEQMPNDDDLLGGQPITLQNNANDILATRKKELDAAVANGDWETILTKSPVRESSALADISKALGFLTMQDYEKAVRHLLADDDDALSFVRGLFVNLFEQLKDWSAA